MKELALGIVVVVGLLVSTLAIRIDGTRCLQTETCSSFFILAVDGGFVIAALAFFVLVYYASKAKRRTHVGEPGSSVTGLYYFGARYYDPTIGRFITEDSYEGDDNDPMSLNMYMHGRDNPER